MLHIYFCDLKPVRAFAFRIPVEMYRGPTSTTSDNFCYNFKPGRAGIVNLEIPAIHSSFLTIFVKNDFNSVMKTPSQPLKKMVVTVEINLWFC